MTNCKIFDLQTEIMGWLIIIATALVIIVLTTVLVSLTIEAYRERN